MIPLAVQALFLHVAAQCPMSGCISNYHAPVLTRLVRSSTVAPLRLIVAIFGLNVAASAAVVRKAIGS